MNLDFDSREEYYDTESIFYGTKLPIICQILLLPFRPASLDFCMQIKSQVCSLLIFLRGWKKSQFLQEVQIWLEF